nr:hypothetical protein [Bacilli bacterium]
MLKLYKNKTNFVAKGITALGASGLGTMIPMHVNAASGVPAEQLYITITGGAALAGIVGVAIYGIWTKMGHKDYDVKEAVEFGVKNGPTPSILKDETTSAKQYFKIVNRK